VRRYLFDEVLDESEAAQDSIDVFAEFGIERDGSCPFGNRPLTA